jgi:hypothetical protein
MSARAKPKPRYSQYGTSDWWHRAILRAQGKLPTGDPVPGPGLNPAQRAELFKAMTQLRVEKLLRKQSQKP